MSESIICQLRKFNCGILDYRMADCDGKVPKVNCANSSHCNPYLATCIASLEKPCVKSK